MSPLAPPAPPITLPALTRAALVEVTPRSRRKGLEVALTRLRGANYNTLLVPVLAEGELLVRVGQTRRQTPVLEGPAGEALALALAQPKQSAWVFLDPLSAGPRGSTEFGGLARRHRGWVMRNALGRRAPLEAQAQPAPLFSWVNLNYRRFLGELLFRLAEAHPFGGIVLDMRAWPGISADSARWVCCSFNSQERAEEALGIDFERLLAFGSVDEIVAWQRWVHGELRVFVEALVARLLTVRSDLSWKLLLPAQTPDGGPGPWNEWCRTGLIDEVFLEASAPRESLEALRATGCLVNPWVATPVEAKGVSRRAAGPSTGLLVLDPGDAASPFREPADGEVPWLTSGAAEDDPMYAASLLTEWMGESLGTTTRLGRYFRRMARYLRDVQPTFARIDRTTEKLRAIRARVAAGTLSESPDAARLLPVIELTERLLGMAKVLPEMR